MDPIQEVIERRRLNVAEAARRVVCTVGVVAELLIAAGGDAPAQANVVTMYGLCTGLAIVGWWIVASAVGGIVKLFQRQPVWHGQDDAHLVVGRPRFLWGQLAVRLLLITGVVVFRIWMPIACILVIR